MTLTTGFEHVANIRTPQKPDEEPEQDQLKQDDHRSKAGYEDKWRR